MTIGAEKGNFMEQCNSDLFPVKYALEMVILFDKAGKIIYANDAAEKNLSYEKGLCNRSISDIFPNEFKNTEHGLEIKYPIGSTMRNMVAYRQNLTCFPVEAKIIESDTQPDLYVCMVNNILEKDYLSREINQVKHEAQQAAKVKSEFVANVTHELRTPVNGVLGNTRDLLELENDPQKLKLLHIIEGCCQDMNKIINNILDFSKLEAGKFTLEPRKFHFRDMLDYVKANHTSNMTEKGLEFFMTVSPQIPEYIIGDELRIKQVLNNLLSNALKFTAAGKVTVEVIQTARVKNKMELFFLVIDSGIGISRDEKDKLFQSFSQVDASISRKYGGTGLGLNICKQLVELMGGQINVESEKGKGSAFSFSVWVEACEENKNDLAGNELTGQDVNMSPSSSHSNMSALFSEMGDDTEQGGLWQFGSEENQEALDKNMSKLILCVEMENWGKAEMFMDTVRQLTKNAPQEVARVVLRLKMAVQKENYEKITAEFTKLEAILQSEEVAE